MKKIILEVEDFKKLEGYIKSLTIPILKAPQAVEILIILNNAKLAEVEETKKETR
jgi:hypothetical protein